VFPIEDLRLNNLKSFFPWAADNAADLECFGSDVHVTMRDGTKLIYDDLDQTIRRLPENYTQMSDHQIDHEFGVRLRRIMARRRVTQSDLAGQLGVTQGMISQYINGYSSPSFRVVNRMANILDCSVDELRCTY
jgi:DNA-binding XRE family transcriptional regulator